MVEANEQGGEQERIREDVNHFGAKLTEFIYRPTNNYASDIESQNRRARMEIKMTDTMHKTGSPPTWHCYFRVPEDLEHPTTTTIQLIDYPVGSIEGLVIDEFTYTADDNKGIVVGPDGITDPTSLSYLRLMREGLLEVVDEVIANPDPGREADLDPVIAGFSALRSAGTRLSSMRGMVEEVQGNLSYYRQVRERRKYRRELAKDWEVTFEKLEDPAGVSSPVESGRGVQQEEERDTIESSRPSLASLIALSTALEGRDIPANIKELLDDEDYLELLEQVKNSASLRGIIDAILAGDDVAQGEIEELDDQTQKTIRTLREKVTTAEQSGTYRPPFETDLEIDLKREAAELKNVLRILAEGNIPNLSKLTPEDREIVVKLGAKNESTPTDREQGKESAIPEPLSQETIDATRDILDRDPMISSRKELLAKESDEILKRDQFEYLEARAGKLLMDNPSLNPTAVFMYLDNLRKEMGVVLLSRVTNVVTASVAKDFVKSALLSAQAEDQEGQERALSLLKLLKEAPLK